MSCIALDLAIDSWADVERLADLDQILGLDPPNALSWLKNCQWGPLLRHFRPIRQINDELTTLWNKP